MRAHLTTGGRRHRVRVDASGGKFTATVDGEAFEGQVDMAKGVVTFGSRAMSFRVLPDGIELAGKSRHIVWEPDLDSGPDTSAAGGSALAVRPPMPGRVVAVFVSEGEEVQRGQRLLVLEAMKMQNEVPAPAAGRVLAVRVKPGDPVAAGDVLVELG
jgi:biotin carboxyl carrier protein